MNISKFSWVVVTATWILLVIGGLVNPMGASLACPDWYFVPTCNGELFPVMKGGVLYEHGHRLWASGVGLLTVILAVMIWLSPKTDRVSRILAIVAVFTVALQGTLGGVTVLLGLNAALSTLHLVLAMSFFCLLIYLSMRLGGQAARGPGRAGFLLAFHLVFVQILLGGLIRHVGAGMACGNDWLSCGPTFWPEWHLGQLHMLHRIIGYCLVGVIGWVCFAQIRTTKWAAMPLILVIFQVALGLLTVATLRHAHVVAMHTAIGALVLASLWVLYWRKAA
ncbi:MAG: COX15/CtaA family protein [Myxococcota bacterium]